MNRKLTIAALQPPLVMLDAAKNRSTIERQVAVLSGAQSLDFVVLPEIFSGWPAARNDPHAAESRAFLQQTSKSYCVNVVGGSLGWAEGTRRFNTCFIADRLGKEVGWYSKRMPFGLEQGRVSPGTTDGVFVVEGLRVGVLICGDLWRPELARALIDRIDVLCVPARSGVAAEANVLYARTLWRNLALTRAVENGLPVVVADWPDARHEVDGITHFTSGGASIVDPSARPDVARLQRTIEAPGAITAVIDLDAMATFRAYRRSVGLIPVESAMEE